MAPTTICEVLSLYWTAAALLILIAAMGSQTQGFTIKMIPIDSIESSLFPKNLTLEEKHQRIASLSLAHAHHLRSPSSPIETNSTHNPTALGPEMMRPPVGRALSNYYVVYLGIGTPSFPTYLLLDTGSDTTWIQCEGCTTCFPIRGGNFKHKNSSTYHILDRDDPLCVPKLYSGRTCLYSIMYPTSSSRGVVSKDTFTFSSTGATFEAVPNVVFGCGLKNENITFGANRGPNNTIAGIFGLGAGPRSILMQLGSRTHGRFSYCLPPWDAPAGTHTYLHFGDDARTSGGRVQTTAMLAGKTRYYVVLLGISVDQKRLQIDPALFQLKPNGSGGFIVDSGSGHTILVRGAYDVLREGVVQYFLRYNWHPLEGRQGPFDLCYNWHVGNFTLPSMTFHFRGADLVLDSRNVFQRLGNVFCMIMVPISEPGPNLLGAFQQANYRFLFDVRASTMSFVPENCQN